MVCATAVSCDDALIFNLTRPSHVQFFIDCDVLYVMSLGAIDCVVLCSVLCSYYNVQWQLTGPPCCVLFCVAMLFEALLGAVCVAMWASLQLILLYYLLCWVLCRQCYARPDWQCQCPVCDDSLVKALPCPVCCRLGPCLVHCQCIVLPR